MGNLLPNLLVAGVPKAGTTSVFAYLGQHPDICASRDKEVGYFLPLRHYTGELPSLQVYERQFRHCAAQRYRVEATPSYCYAGPRLIAGIRRILGRPKVILILRDPVERLWSAYTFQRTKGNLAKVENFEEYLAVCRERRRQGTAWQGGRHYSGLSIGFYGDYVENWLEAFGEDTRIIFADDLFADPLGVLRGICHWLDIDSDTITSFDVDARHATAHARNTRVARWVYVAKGAADTVLRKNPKLRDGLKGAYLRLNTGDLTETLPQGTRSRLEATYRESNRRVATALAARGYQSLPEWLRTAPWP